MTTEAGTGPSLQEPNQQFEHLLEYLRRNRGFDFTGYKRSSLVRRVAKRMEVVGIEGFTAYMDYLEVHPEEFGRLFDTILINVTAFFRDDTAWELIGTEIIPRIVGPKRPDDPIRCWCAGCASGEEAYTIAMQFAEALGLEAARDHVKIYATDVDEEALARARHAQYEERQIEGVPETLREKYFEKVNGRYVVNKDLRRMVIFGRHDLIQDAPISRIDLLVCRNTLMYLNSETQSRILERFHFALSERGVMFLGKAETLLTYNNTFTPIDLKRRVFTKVPRNSLRDRLMVMARTGNDEAVNHLINHVRIREAAFDTSTIAQMVVDFSGLLNLANEKARLLFRLAPADLGRPLQDLRVSYRPAELRSCIDRAYAERRPVTLAEVEWSPTPGEVTYYEIHVVPLIDSTGALIGASITFLDITANKKLQDSLQTTKSELETAYEEIQSTNEELETTNEELQSTVEELETTNEELQSTNEELETMNEELQSTNEELETVNEELRERGDEVRKINLYLESILGNFRSGVAVLDTSMMVHVWNRRAADLWGLRDEEVRGKNFVNLDLGLPVRELQPIIQACLGAQSELRELVLDAVNRRGKPFRCRVSCSPTRNTEGIFGAVLTMTDEDDQAPFPMDGYAQTETTPP
jgi:two-component system CheB/CheR fusion protein